MTHPTLVWFRNDLRLADNPALSEAVAAGGEVIPVYVLDDEAAGPWRLGGAARWWLHHSLASLQAMAEGLSGSLWQQIGYLAAHYDAQIGAATWQDHVPTFALNPASIVVALTVGVACWALFQLVWGTGRFIGNQVAGLTASRPRYSR